jgi:TetR/AcrR family transcriptional regulator
MSVSLAIQESSSSRDRILDVAEWLFARRGFNGVGLREVADQAGLGKSSLFHHFQTKSELYCQVILRTLERIRAHVQPALDSDGTAAGRLDRVVDALIDALVGDPPSARLLLRSMFEDEMLPESAHELPEHKAAECETESMLSDFGMLIREGIDSGVFRRVSVPHTIQSLIGAIVFHFASGELGEKLIHSELLAPEAVAARRREVKDLLRHGMVAEDSATAGEKK